MLRLQLLLGLENMMTVLLMMPRLQKLIQRNQMKVRMRTLILPKMVIVVMPILLLRLMSLILLQRIPLMLMRMFLMFVMFLMVLRQMPLFLLLMLLMTLMPLQWGYLRGRRRSDFIKFEKFQWREGCSELHREKVSLHTAHVYKTTSCCPSRTRCWI